MPTDTQRERSLQWLFGFAVLENGSQLPTMACASKSTLRVVGNERDLTRGMQFDRRRRKSTGNGVTGNGNGGQGVRPGRTGLRLIFNDDHGMAPSVTIVNQTNETVSVRAIWPSVLATDNGTYDLDALMGAQARDIAPGHPLVIRVSDIGRNRNDAFRSGQGSLRAPMRAARRDPVAVPQGLASQTASAYRSHAIPCEPTTTDH